MASKEYEHRQMLMNLRAFADKNLRFTRLDDEKFSAHITWVVPLGGSFVLPLIPGVPGLNEEKDVENPHGFLWKMIYTWWVFHIELLVYTRLSSEFAD